MNAIEFPDLDLALLGQRSHFRLGAPLAEVFPNISDKKANIGSQFVEPWRVMQATVSWVWLAILKNMNAQDIAEVIREIVLRSVAASKCAGGDNFRSEHDVLLLLACILSRNRELMELASDTVVVADLSVEKYQFFHAWTGILRARILNRPDLEVQQLGVLLRKRGLTGTQCPSHALAKAFCAKDYRKMTGLMKKTFKSEWNKCDVDKSIESDASGRTKMFLRWRDSNMYWPWAEAGFAKLAFMSGVSMPTDAVWLPDRLLSMAI